MPPTLGLAIRTLRRLIGAALLWLPAALFAQAPCICTCDAQGLVIASQDARGIAAQITRDALLAFAEWKDKGTLQTDDGTRLTIPNERPRLSTTGHGTCRRKSTFNALT